MDDAMILRIEAPTLLAKLKARIRCQETLTKTVTPKKQEPPKEQIQRIWGKEFEGVYDEETNTEDVIRLLTLQGKKRVDGEEMDTEPFDEAECSLPLTYWRVDEEGVQYHVQYGEDTYHATAVTLPTTVEVLKSAPNESIKATKSHDVHRMLIVHNQLVVAGSTCTSLSEACTPAGTYIHGLTPPMQYAVTGQFQVHTAQARRDAQEITLPELENAESEFMKYHQVWVRNQQHATERHRGPSATRSSSSSSAAAPAAPFVYEEVVEVEPWMALLPEVYTMNKGEDDFKTAFQHAIQEAKREQAELD
jgi:hypothetical protein